MKMEWSGRQRETDFHPFIVGQLRVRAHLALGKTDGGRLIPLNRVGPTGPAWTLLHNGYPKASGPSF
jgi:hypothetical protein